MNDSHETLVKVTGLKFPEPIDKGLFNLIKGFFDFYLRFKAFEA